MYFNTKNLKKKRKLNYVKVESFFLKKTKKINYELNLFKNDKIYLIFYILFLKLINYIYIKHILLYDKKRVKNRKSFITIKLTIFC